MEQLALSGMLDITGVAELKERLQVALDDPAPLELDAVGLDWIDASSLQLLVVFFQEALLRSKSVSWKAVSDELLAAAQLMGLEESLCLSAPGQGG